MIPEFPGENLQSMLSLRTVFARRTPCLMARASAERTAAQFHGQLRTVPPSQAKHFGTLHDTLPRNGVFDTVRSKMNDMRQDTEEGREQKAFEAQMKFLCDDEHAIDGNVYLETVDELKRATGLSGFREHLPWVANSPILSDMKREEEILKSFSEFERKHPARATISAKKRVGREVNVDLSEVESLLERVVAMRDVQRWILSRRSQGEPIPSTNTELQQMLTAPRSGFKRTRMYRGNSFRNPGVKRNKTGKRW